MDTRLTQERRETASPSWSTTTPDRRPQPNPAAARPAGAPNAAAPTVAERLSNDPLRATDRYRLVMPYSLRV